MSSSILKSIGKEIFCCIMYLIFNGVIGLSLSYLCAYYFELNLFGVWFGYNIGLALCIIIFAIVIIKIDIEKCVIIIYSRLNEYNEIE